MTDYIRGDIQGYLGDLSGRKIAPGGGSASALVAAAGAALNLMVINFSGGKGDAVPGDLGPSMERQRKSLEVLSSLVDKDCEVFTGLMDSLSKKKDAQDKYKEAALVPMEVCRECHVSVEISRHLMGDSDKSIVTDIGCAVHMLKAAFYSARLNVLINLKFIKDREFVDNAEKALSGMKKDIDCAERDIAGRINRMLKTREG